MPPKQTKTRYVAYYRVSADRQGRSGLGLEAQKNAVEAFVKRSGGAIRAEFTETQSGKDDDRPQLHEALKLCRLTNCTLLIAKLDRLSREVAFLSALQKTGAKFLACDLPGASEMVVNILAAVAQEERKLISERTKAALAVARSRDTRLGNPKLKPGTAVSAAKARQARIKKADDCARDLAAVLQNAEIQGHATLRQMARYLNDLEFESPKGKRWHANSVRRIRQRISAMAAPPLQSISRDGT
jgi:DNA invertase Pin-like site-specific DNA recombinase